MATDLHTSRTVHFLPTDITYHLSLLAHYFCNKFKSLESAMQNITELLTYCMLLPLFTGSYDYQDGEEDFRHYWQSNHLHQCAREPVPTLCPVLGKSSRWKKHGKLRLESSIPSTWTCKLRRARRVANIVMSRSMDSSTPTTPFC